MGILSLLGPAANSAGNKAKDMAWAFTGIGVPEGVEDRRTLKDKIFGGDGSKGERLSDSSYFKALLQMHASRTKTNLGPVRDHNLYTDGSHIYSGPNRVAKIFTVEDMPEEMVASLSNALRNMLFTIDPSVRVSVVSALDREFFEFGSARWKSIENTWRNSYKKTQEDSDTSNAYDAQESSKMRVRNDRRQHSTAYFKDVQATNRGIWTSSISIIITGVRGEGFDKCEEAIRKINHTLQFHATPVDNNLVSLMAYYSPAISPRERDKLSKLESSVPLTSEIITQMSPTERGSTGSQGICWGQDVVNHQPVMKVVKQSSTDAENWLITAMTGAGKSFFVKMLLLQLLQDPDYMLTLLDFEGFEYTSLVDTLNEGADSTEIPPAARLDVSSTGGRYLDTMNLTIADAIGGYEINEEDMQTLAEVLFGATQGIFQALLEITLTEDGNIKKDADQNMMEVVRESIDAVYDNVGVQMSFPHTWENSKNLKIHDVYFYMKDLSEKMTANTLSGTKGSNLTEIETRRLALVRAVKKLSPYFEETGTKANKFSQSYSMSNITQNRVLILSMGMAGKATTGQNPVDRSLTRLFTSVLATLRTRYAKSQQKYNVKLWEEFQRWSEDRGMDSLVNTAITGGRKMGEVNIIVTNDIKKLIHDDRFAIMGNITSYAIGALKNTNDINDLVAELHIPEYTESLYQIRNSTDVSSEDDDDDNVANRGGSTSATRKTFNQSNTSPYSQAFLVSLGSGSKDKHVSKMHVGDTLANSTLFRTSPKGVENE